LISKYTVKKKNNHLIFIKKNAKNFQSAVQKCTAK